MEPTAEQRLEEAQAVRDAGSSGEAIVLLDGLIAELKPRSDLEDRILLTRALSTKANTLDALGRHADELLVRQDLVERELGAVEPRMRVRVACELVNTGVTLEQLGRPEEMLAVYDSVVDRFGDDEDIAIASQASRARLLKAGRLVHLGRADEALFAYDALIARYRDVGDSKVRRRVAGAILEKGRLLAARAEYARAIAAFEEMPPIPVGASDPVLVRRVAAARFGLGAVLEHIGKHDEAIQAYDRVLRMPVDIDNDSLIDVHLRSALDQARILRKLGRVERTRQVLHDATVRFDGVRGAPAHRLLVRMLVLYAKVLRHLGRRLEAFAAVERALELLDGDDAAHMRWTANDALLQHAILLEDRDEPAAAASVFRSVFDRHAASNDVNVAGQASWAAILAIRAYGKAYRPEDAVAVARLLITRFSGADDWQTRQRVKSARLVVATVPGAQRALARVERHQRLLAIAAATASAGTAAAWARRRASRHGCTRRLELRWHSHRDPSPHRDLGRRHTEHPS
jgi:tetratricopeptide (TPR) repeat protein